MRRVEDAATRRRTPTVAWRISSAAAPDSRFHRELMSSGAVQRSKFDDTDLAEIRCRRSAAPVECAPPGAGEVRRPHRQAVSGRPKG